MAQRLAKKLLVIGWDAADWTFIDPLLACGKLPNLRMLVERGCRGDLRTLEPKLSPLLWTSIATGKTADKHGILNFVEPRPDGAGLRLSSSTSRRTKALWNILSQNQLTTHVIGWYATHPAESIRGSVVSNMLQEGEPTDATAAWALPSGVVHPPQLAMHVAESRQRALSFSRQQLKRLAPAAATLAAHEPRLATLCKLMAYATSIEQTAIDAMNSAPWDCTMVFFDAIDTVGHYFMQYVPPRMDHVSEEDVLAFGNVMENVYQWHDESLGRLMKAAGPDVTVVLESDHGFHSGKLRPVLVDLPPERRAELESSWHRPLGIIAMAGPGIQAGAHPSLPSILDIAPTALALLGLPAGEDFDGRVLCESLTSKSAPTKVGSWDVIDGEAGLHPADLRQDPFEAVDAIKQLIDLGYMAALPGDVQGQLDLVSRESRFNLAVVLMTTQRHAQAAEVLRTLTKARPAEPRYALNLGQCLYAVGDFAGAALVLQEFLNHDSASVEARILLAGALGMSGRERQGAAEIGIVEMAIGRRPDLALGLADCLCALDDFARAKTHYDAALGLDSSDPAVHIGLARVQLGLGNFEEAAGHALDALELNQALVEAHYLLGAALAWFGDWENSIRSCQFAVQYEPKHLDAHRFIFLCGQKTGNAELRLKHDAKVRELVQLSQPRREVAFGPRAFAARNQLEFR